jgi:nucleotide-binding universal stress UspA family protein
MDRVLVPLDGTDLAASILPDALRLVGERGELMLIRDASRPAIDNSMGVYGQRPAIEASELYLGGIAHIVRRQGTAVRTRTFVMGNPARSVAEAVAVLKPDIIACATHGRSGVQRLLYGSMAHRILIHSTVPVMLRHATGDEPPVEFRTGQAIPRRIMVPLDGSPLAETALPLARRLCAQWDADLFLVRVVGKEAVPGPLTGGVPQYSGTVHLPGDIEEAESYLSGVAARIPGPVYRMALGGSAGDALIEFACAEAMTDIVMASHGRTGLARILLGSVADELIHRLHLPIVVVPALAHVSVEQTAEWPAHQHDLQPV